MSRPVHPSRIRRAALVPALVVLPIALAPTVASADYTTANTWAGGAASAARADSYPARATAVSLMTGPSVARLYVSLAAPQCAVKAALRGTATPQAGGIGDLLSVRVTARGTRTTVVGSDYRARTRLTVTLAPAAPGVLVGTVTARGKGHSRGRTSTCASTQAVRLTSRAGLVAPFQPFTTDLAAGRVGIVSSTITSRLPGAIALARRRDGTFHGISSLRLRCRQGSKRTVYDFNNLVRRFHIRADGSFRGRRAEISSGRYRGVRLRSRLVSTISGRIGPDGVARGRIAVALSSSATGSRTYACRSGSVAFAGAP